MDTNFENLLKEYQPELYHKIKSEQNELSKDILKLRMLNKLSVEETAKYLNMDIEDYLNYEFGENVNRSVMQYQEVLLNMENIVQKYENNINVQYIFESYKSSVPKFKTIENDRIIISSIKDEFKKNHSVGGIVFSGTEEKRVISSTSENIFNKVSNFFRIKNNANEKYLKSEELICR